MNSNALKNININDDNTKTFKPLSWLVKIDIIKELILKQRNVVVSVLAEEHGGKTSFCNLTQQLLKSDIDTHILSIPHLFDATWFVTIIQQTLGIFTDNTLEAVFTKVSSMQKPTLVIIDDAQNLSETFIEQLFKELGKFDNDNSYLHFCFVANKTILSKLQNLHKNEQYQELIHNLEIGQFSKEETIDYVKYRLKAYEEVLTEKRLTEFHEMTQGNIVLINSQLSSFFWKEVLLQRNKKQKQSISKKIGVAFVSLFVVFGVVKIMQPKHTRVDNKDGSLVQQSLVLPKLSKAKPKPIREVEVVYESSLPTPYEKAVYKKMVSTLMKAKDIETLEKDNENAELVVLDSIIAAPKSFDKPKKIAQKPKSAKAKPNKNYTIQVMASQSVDSLKTFIHDNRLQNKTKIYLSKRNGQSWYVLTTGEFNNYNLAKNNIDNLPPKIAKRGAWVRNMRDLEAIG